MTTIASVLNYLLEYDHMFSNYVHLEYYDTLLNYLHLLYDNHNLDLFSNWIRSCLIVELDTWLFMVRIGGDLSKYQRNLRLTLTWTLTLNSNTYPTAPWRRPPIWQWWIIELSWITRNTLTISRQAPVLVTHIARNRLSCYARYFYVCVPLFFSTYLTPFYYFQLLLHRSIYILFAVLLLNML